MIVVGSLLSWLVMLLAGQHSRPPIVLTPAAPDVAPHHAHSDGWVPPYRAGAPAPPTAFAQVPAAGPGIVWVNTRSRIYHYIGYRWYGRTIWGKLTSERDAMAEGDRAALNERLLVDFNAAKR